MPKTKKNNKTNIWQPLIGFASLGWLAGWLAGRLAGWQAGWLVSWLAGKLAGWLAGWLTDLLAGWLAAWLVGGGWSISFLLLRPLPSIHTTTTTEPTQPITLTALPQLTALSRAD